MSSDIVLLDIRSGMSETIVDLVEIESLSQCNSNDRKIVLFIKLGEFRGLQRELRMRSRKVGADTSEMFKMTDFIEKMGLSFQSGL